jgi:hypothetical protein
MLVTRTIPQAREALANPLCESLISRTNADAGKALDTLVESNRIVYDPERVANDAKEAGADPALAAGFTDCPNGVCTVYLGLPAFNAVTANVLNDEEEALLTLLHELAHVTDTTYSRTAEIDTRAFDQAIIETCIKPLRP